MKTAEDIVDFHAFGVDPARLEHPGGVIAGHDEVKGPDLVDCARRFSTCRSCCCSLYTIPLTRVEVAAGWYDTEPDNPAQLRRDANGTCVHHDVTTGRCGIWERRPLVCRLYWCIDAEGVWSDFSRGRLSKEARQVVELLTDGAGS